MANRTVIYDSSSYLSYVGAAVILDEYPFADQVDLSGLNKTNTDTAIAAVESNQEGIYMCVSNNNTDEVTAVAGTAVITFTAGAAGEIGYVQVANAAGDVLLSVGYTTAATTDTADAAIVKGIINDGTAFHGFSADNTLGVLTISAPTSAGATANTYVATADADTGGTLAIAITTDFDSTGTGSGTGVTGVDFTAGTLQASQNTTLDGKMASGSATSVFTTGGKNTPLVAWETLHSGTVAPRLVTMLGGYNTIASDATSISVLQATLPLLLTDIDVYGGVWNRLINWGDKLDAQNYPVPDQDLELLRLLTGEEFAEKRDNLI
jgi:hypothetical protein